MTTDMTSADDALDAKFEQERHDFAVAQMEIWDRRRTRRIVCSLLSMVWLSVGGQTLFPLGFVMALMVLVPEVSGWSLLRRVRFTGRRSLFLLGFAVLGLLLVRARLGLFDGDSTFSLGCSFGLPF
ncbi:MAG: hypothetical protein QM765_37475 [Myxococcales bacterium]